MLYISLVGLCVCIRNYCNYMQSRWQPKDNLVKNVVQHISKYSQSDMVKLCRTVDTTPLYSSVAPVICLCCITKVGRVPAKYAETTGEDLIEEAMIC